MFKMNITVDDNDSFSGYELGNIEFSNDDICESSYNKSPDQSMMIFITISDLLSALYKFKIQKLNYVEVIGTDSSFTMVFIRRKNKVKLLVNSIVIGDGIEENKFIKIIYTAINDFCKLNLCKITVKNPIRQDIENALELWRIYYDF